MAILTISTILGQLSFFFFRKLPSSPCNLVNQKRNNQKEAIEINMGKVRFASDFLLRAPFGQYFFFFFASAFRPVWPARCIWALSVYRSRLAPWTRGESNHGKLSILRAPFGQYGPVAAFELYLYTAVDSRPGPGGVEPRQAVSPKALRPWTIPLRYSVG